ncbi:MAG: S49 family peptidase [Myxococcota bacterium]|nr:S49 family peptidase [Myxococcota bacterium]
MRPVIALIVNLFRLLFAVLGGPLRLLRRRRRVSYLHFRLEGDPPYRPGKRKGLSLFRKKAEPATVTSVAQLQQQLEEVARDPTVHGAMFDLETLEVAPAKREAIAALIRSFRAAGKKAVGFAVTAGTSEYVLLCEMDQILMPSAGRLDVTGFAAEATAAGAAFKRFGIGAHFVRRGPFKTAPELFTEPAISENVRGLLSRLLEERYLHLVGVISRTRRLSVDQVREKIDQGPYSARRALAEGLCDSIVSEADLPEFLTGGAVEVRPFERRIGPPAEKKKEKKSEEKKDEKRVRLASYRAYSRQQPWAPGWMSMRAKARVGLVKVEGMIVSGEGGRGLGSFAGAKSISKALRAAQHDPRVESVLLYVNSGGGSAIASELILEEARNLQRKKPVIAYFDRISASGGYMAMLAADEIWGGPMSLVGSIGVFAGKFETSELFARLGVAREVIAFGQNAGLHSTSRPFTGPERESLETEVQETYEAFLDLVGGSRGMTRDQVHQRGEGRVYSAATALEAGLVDRIGSFDEACRRALALAGEKRSEYELLPFGGGKSGLGALASAAQELTSAQVWAMWVPDALPPDLVGPRTLRL